MPSSVAELLCVLSPGFHSCVSCHLGQGEEVWRVLWWKLGVTSLRQGRSPNRVSGDNLDRWGSPAWLTPATLLCCEPRPERVTIYWKPQCNTERKSVRQGSHGRAGRHRKRQRDEAAARTGSESPETAPPPRPPCRSLFGVYGAACLTLAVFKGSSVGHCVR